MADDQIRYDALAQEALRGVVRTVLDKVAASGLPGDHHLYIAFDTEADGVSMSDRLRKEYPEEMTVVLQHQFWDLEVYEDRFSVKLAFNNIPEQLVVPFTSIKAFYDPSVQFGLQFGEPDSDYASEEDENDKAAVPAIVNEETGNTGFSTVQRSAKDLESSEESDAENTAASGSKVVELDAFRKK